MSSKRVSKFFPCFAEISTDGIFPPHDSRRILFSASSFLTRSEFASGLSILLIATMNGMPVSRRMAIASFVCGFTPSSAATTKIPMSATDAPRERIFENASCPGVSMNVISFPLCAISYAPICWVIPPDSFSAIFVFRMVSRRVVFPWSICPTTTTIGGRVIFEIISFFRVFVAM